MRGRDVVLRRISKILEAGEPTNLEYSSLVELGVIVLETLERMDQSQKLWEKCRERTVRQLELRKQGGREWIIPEVADVIQRQMSAVQSGASVSGEEIIPLKELLTLLVHAFALSSGVTLEDFTIQMVQKALVESVLQVDYVLSYLVALIQPPLTTCSCSHALIRLQEQIRYPWRLQFLSYLSSYPPTSTWKD